MLQGGRGARVERGRNVMFFVGFLFAFLVPIFCTAIAFEPALLFHDKLRWSLKQGFVPMSLMRIADGNVLFITIFFTANCETQSNFSIATPKERLCSTHAESSHEKVHAQQNDVRKDINGWA